MSENELPEYAIRVPPLCQRHQRAVVDALNYKPNDPWQAALVVANLYMFQGATTEREVWEACPDTPEGRDARTLSTVLSRYSCLACAFPQHFRRLSYMLHTDGLTAVAKLTLGAIYQDAEAMNKHFGGGPKSDGNPSS